MPFLWSNSGASPPARCSTYAMDSMPHRRGEPPRHSRLLFRFGGHVFFLQLFKLFYLCSPFLRRRSDNDEVHVQRRLAEVQLPGHAHTAFGGINSRSGRKAEPCDLFSCCGAFYYLGIFSLFEVRMVAQIDAEVICGGVPSSQLSVGGIGEIDPGVGGSHVSLRYGYFQHQLIEEVDVICSLCGISRA